MYSNDEVIARLRAEAVERCRRRVLEARKTPHQKVEYGLMAAIKSAYGL